MVVIHDIMQNPSTPALVQPWILTESTRLSRSYLTAESVITVIRTHQPAAAGQPDLDERITREFLALRLPVKRPLWLPISASAMRSALATTPVSIVALALTGKTLQPAWNGTGWGLPPDTTLVFSIVIILALLAVGLQVSADLVRHRFEERSDQAFISHQLTQLLTRANDFLSARKPVSPAPAPLSQPN